MKNLIIFLFLLALIGCSFEKPNTLPISKEFVRTISISPLNSVIISGRIDDESVLEASTRLLALSKALRPTDDIYVILNSGGGSIDAGLAFISHMKSIPQKVHTISIYAFSMAFVIMQHSHTRYITYNSRVGQHKAFVGGAKGTIPNGTFDTNIDHFRYILNKMMVDQANKIGMPIDKFLSITSQEWWLYEMQAVENKVADELIIMNCVQLNYCVI